MKKNNPKTARKHPVTIEDYFFTAGCIVPAFILAAAAACFLYPPFRQFLKLPPCLFHLLTGYYCPGCGGTRAVKALFHGQLLRAFYYHPFVPYAAAVYVYFMVTQAAERISRGKYAIGMHYHNACVWTAVAIIVFNFILKNILHRYYGFML